MPKNAKHTKKPRPRRRANRPKSSRPPRPVGRHRRVIPGATWFVTQKTSDDLFWLVPGLVIDMVLIYLLLLKARQYGIRLHAFSFMSNHFHLVLTDPRGKLPDFMREFVGESGKAIQLVRKTNRTIWRKKRYSAVQLLDRDAVECAIAYTLLNPLEAGLTMPGEWPGLTSARYDFGEILTATRPDIYFSKNRPETASCMLFPVSAASAELWGNDAPMAEDTSGEAAAARAERDAASEQRICDMVDARTAQVLFELAQRGESLAGPERVMQIDCTTRTSHPIRDLNPKFATRNRELLEHAIEDHRQFEIAHEEAKRKYIAGDRKTVFPRGTYGYRVVLGVRVARKRRPAA